MSNVFCAGGGKCTLLCSLNGITVKGAKARAYLVRRSLDKCACALALLVATVLSRPVSRARR